LFVCYDAVTALTQRFCQNETQSEIAPTAAHAASRGVDEVSHENGIATHDNLSREYFVLQINGRIDLIHRRYEDAVRAGLLLKNQFPHFDIKVREINSSEEEVLHGTVLH
jgi:hypothetical protein